MAESSAIKLQEYLDACGSTAIWIGIQAGHLIVSVGRCNAPSLQPHERVFWTTRSVATALARHVRKNTNHNSSLDDATHALREAAVRHRAVLTPHAQMLVKARSFVEGLKAYLEHLRNTGALREFNAEYRRRRAVAEGSGAGFMSYGNAELRLRRAVLSRLAGGRKSESLKSLFVEIFGNVPCHHDNEENADAPAGH